ncbi:MAG: hypothetical protein V4671_26705, partial [Armatimonadota bacterium]
MPERDDALWSGYADPNSEADPAPLPPIRANLNGVLFADKANGGYLQAYKDESLGISYSVNANSR